MLQPFNFYSGPATNELAKWNIQKLKYKLELAAMWQEKTCTGQIIFSRSDSNLYCLPAK